MTNEELSNLKENDELVLHSKDGTDYKVIIESINCCRPDNMRYAVDVINSKGENYYEASGDYYFCGKDFISQCELK